MKIYILGAFPLAKIRQPSDEETSNDEETTGNYDFYSYPAHRMPAANFQNVADDVVLPLQRLKGGGSDDGGDFGRGNADLDEAQEGAQR